eukprot:SAG31_NODE_12838_length_913_cov_1.063882_1_plen_172_part_00
MERVRGGHATASISHPGRRNPALHARIMARPTRPLPFEFRRNPNKALAALDTPQGASTTAVDRLTEERKEEMRSAFRMFDSDGGGAVSSSEIADVFDQLGVKLTSGQVDNYVELVDMDGSGEVDFEEFCELMEVSLFITIVIVADTVQIAKRLRVVAEYPTKWIRLAWRHR